jgi:hypothetical protein
MQKIVVHSSEAAALLGISIRQAQNELKQISEKNNLKKSHSVPVDIFCRETGTDMALVLAVLNNTRD